MNCLSAVVTPGNNRLPGNMGSYRCLQHVEQIKYFIYYTKLGKDPNTQ